MTSVNGQPQAKTWINGQYVTATQSSNGKWYAVDNNGKIVEIDPNNLLCVNNFTAEVVQDIEEQKDRSNKWKNHWLALQQKASDMYDSAVETCKKLKKQYDQFMSNVECAYANLTGSQKKEADEFLAGISDAGKQKRRGASDTMFYGRMAADEATYIGELSNQQTLAKPFGV